MPTSRKPSQPNMQQLPRLPTDKAAASFSEMWLTLSPEMRKWTAETLLAGVSKPWRKKLGF